MPLSCLVCRLVVEEGESGYFSLPKDQSDRVKWLKATKLDEKYYGENYKLSWKICWRHFDPSQIKINGQRRSLQKGVFLSF